MKSGVINIIAHNGKEIYREYPFSTLFPLMRLPKKDSRFPRIRRHKIALEIQLYLKQINLENTQERKIKLKRGTKNKSLVQFSVYPSVIILRRVPGHPTSCLPPHLAAPTHYTFHGAPWRSRWSDVQEEYGHSMLRRARVVVDYVTNKLLFPVPCARHVPIVSVERWFAPVKCFTIIG